MRSSSFVCCRCSVTNRRAAEQFKPVLSLFRTHRTYSQSSQTLEAAAAPPAKLLSPKLPVRANDKHFWGSDVTISSANKDALVRRAQTFGDTVLNTQSIPHERDVLASLTLIKYAALQLNSETSHTEENSYQEASSGKLTVLNHPGTNKVQHFKHEDPQRITTRVLSMLAYKIIKHPPVFISPTLLEAFVDAQIALHKLDTIPEVFDLYAHKPTPKPGSSPITYVNTNTSDANLAIPTALGNQVLELAIQEKKLPLALDLIASSFGTPAYRRNRFMRKAFPFLGTFSLSPFVAWSIARAWADSSVTLETGNAPLAALGILTYIGTCSSLGWFSMAGYNDHMERVTWIPGTPMNRRWAREEERAAIDKVAVAWGFNDKRKWGTEDGQEWEWLKVWCGERGMRLDASELMEGME